MEERMKQVEELGRQHATRLDDHEERILDLEREERRTRKRLHELESDRHALSLATTAVTQLANKVGRAADSMEQLALDAASKAIGMDRSERREHAWKTAVRVAAILGAAGTIAYAIFAIVSG